MNLPLRLLVLVALLLATPFPGAHAAGGESEPASEPSTHLILVRHAEKEAGGSDPGLTDGGQRRAEALVHLLQDHSVDRLLASQFERTQATLRPLAADRELTVIVSPIDRPLEEWAKRFAAQLVREYAGQTVVIAGHSNTTPLLGRALGAAIPDLDEAKDYDDLFWITLRDGEVELRHLHYGERSD